jgi:hypothetical protein
MGHVFKHGEPIVTNVLLISSDGWATRSTSKHDGAFGFAKVQPGNYFLYAEYWMNYQGWAARCVPIIVDQDANAEADLQITEPLGDASQGEDRSFPAHLCPEAGWTP